jgi:predicted nuclease of predicted toxin-antitoxin system
MRLLANEKLPREAVLALRAAGHDVAWAAEDCPSVADASVLAQAVREARVLLTQDKDFGDLAFRSRLPASCGIVLFRIAPFPDAVSKMAVRVLAGASFEGRFVVVEEGRLRERPLPDVTGTRS